MKLIAITMSAAALAAPFAAAGKADIGSAEAYVRQLYAALPNPRPSSVRYAPALKELIARDSAYSTASKEVGALDAQPLCGCQDTAENYAVVAVHARVRSPERTTVDVTLRNGDTQRFSIDLVAASGRWLVEDIHGSDMPSLHAFLAREVPQEERSLLSQSRRH